MTENIKNPFSDVNLNDSQLIQVDVPDVTIINSNAAASITNNSNVDTNKDASLKSSDSNKPIEFAVDDTDIKDATITDSANPNNTSKDSDDKGVNPEFLTALANTLKDEGFLTAVPENFDGTSESFIQLMGKEVELGINAYKESLPPVVKEIIDKYEDGVPLNTLIELKSEQVVLDNISDDDIKKDEELQRTIVQEFYRLKGMGETESLMQLNALENTGNLKDFATAAHKNLQKYYKEQEVALQQQTAIQRQKAEQARIDRLTQVKKEVEGTKEIIPGMVISNNQKDQLYKSMTTIVGQDNTGRPLDVVGLKQAQDPVKFARTLHYLNMLGVFDGDWSKIIQVGKKASITEFEKHLKNTSGVKPAGNVIIKETDAKANLDAMRSLT